MEDLKSGKSRKSVLYKWDGGPQKRERQKKGPPPYGWRF
jgi:hypothetical protein